jgi:hypothetical protein
MTIIHEALQYMLNLLDLRVTHLSLEAYAEDDFAVFSFLVWMIKEKCYASTTTRREWSIQEDVLSSPVRGAFISHRRIFWTRLGKVPSSCWCR